MDSGLMSFILVLAVLAAVMFYWAQLLSILYLALKVGAVLVAVISSLQWLEEKEMHNRTKAMLETMKEQVDKLKRRGETIITPNTTLLESYKKQEKVVEDMVMMNEAQSKELQKMETLIRSYKMFRQWIEDEASNSYSRVCFTEYEPSEIDGITNNLDRMRCLGSGAYGTVYEVVLRSKTFAMKILNDSEKGVREFNQEVEILKRIRHQNLVTLIGACSNKFTLILELLPNGTLEDCLTKEEHRESFSWKERVKVADSICCALVFLHNTEPPIVHADLKPSNVLFSSENVCKLSDFGISRLLRNTTDTETHYHHTQEPKGSVPYKDPEFDSTGKLTAMSDVFALGIILLQLVSGEGAMGLRNLVLQNMEIIKSQKLSTSKKKKVLEKCHILDPKLKLDGKSFEDAITMLSLGIRCSEDTRDKRPSLGTEVWPQIYSMNTQNVVRDNHLALDESIA